MWSTGYKKFTGEDFTKILYKNGLYAVCKKPFLGTHVKDGLGLANLLKLAAPSYKLTFLKHLMTTTYTKNVCS